MTLRLNGDNSGFTEIKAADNAGDNSIKLPASNGSANELLKNSGTAGELEYATGVSADTSGNLTATALRGGGVASTLDSAPLNSHLTTNRNGLVIQRLDGIAAGQTTGIQFRQEYTTGSGNGRRMGFFGFERALSTSGDQQGHFVMELCPNNSDNIGSSSPNAATQAFRFTNSGRLQLLKSGGGIDFSGISSTANTGTTVDNNLLDDYEEGSWTPTLNRQFSSGFSATHTAQDGFYVKVGRLVFITFRLATSAISGGSGYYRVDGLPFTVSPTDPEFYSQILSNDHGNLSMASTDYQFGGYSRVNGTDVTLIVSKDISGTRASEGFLGWNNNSIIYMSGSYVAAS